MGGTLGNKNHLIHGFSHKEKLYGIWKGMRQRCRDKNINRANSYVNKGISVCPDWSDYLTFRTWAYSTGYMVGLSLDRIDNNGNYEPSNCRWVDYKTQANNKSTNHKLTYNGETKTISEWADCMGISQDTLKRRIYYGWSVEKALTTPVRGHKKYEIKRLSVIPPKCDGGGF